MKITIKTYYCIESHEFDALVQRTYPSARYEFVADEEANNYSSYTFDDVESGKALDDYDASKLEMLKAGGTCRFVARILIQDMVNNGVLEPGSYLIEVFW